MTRDELASLNQEQYLRKIYPSLMGQSRKEKPMDMLEADYYSECRCISCAHEDFCGMKDEEDMIVACTDYVGEDS